MTELTRQQALDWLVKNVKTWPLAKAELDTNAPKGAMWHIDVVGGVNLLLIDAVEFIAEGDWSVEKGRISSELRRARNERWVNSMTEKKGMVRCSVYVPDDGDAAKAIKFLAEKLREDAKNDG